MEGKCYQCEDWIPLVKNRKRSSSLFTSIELARECLLKPYDSQTLAPVVIAESPLKIIVGRDESDHVFVPVGIVVSPSLLLEMKEHKETKKSSLYWRHAHNCHKPQITL